VLHGFIRRHNGSFVIPPDPVPGNLITEFAGINSAGVILGYTTPDGSFVGARNFLLQNGVYTFLDGPPDATLTQCLSINDRGQIAGTFDDSLGTHGFLLDNGVFTTIDFPNTVLTVALSINNKGQIVGFFLDEQFSPRGFLLDRGVYFMLDFPGALETMPHTINDKGQIVGFYDVETGWVLGHGFVATPVRGRK